MFASLFVSCLIMFIGSFIVQFLIMSYIMTSSYKDVTINLSKFYMSIFMALWMVIIEIFMHNLYNLQFHKFLYIPFLILIIVFGILYRYQIKVDDKQFLKEMIEHHSMAILMSNEIKKKSNDNDIIILANNIVKSQNKEIELMKKMLNKKTNNENKYIIIL